MATLLVHNAYPLLPVMPFEKTMVPMDNVVAYIDSLSCPTPIKDSVFMIFRNESGNGQHGINNNYGGIQADGGTIGHGVESKVIGTCLEPENGTNRVRRFCCFADFTATVDYIVSAVTAKGLYIGGHTHDAYSNIAINNIADWTLAYYQEWVTGNIKATLEEGSPYFSLFASLYHSAQADIV